VECVLIEDCYASEWTEILRQFSSQDIPIREEVVLVPIEFSLKIKGEKLNDDLLLAGLRQFGDYACHVKTDEETFDVDKIYDTIGFALTCVKKVEMGYETRFLNNQVFSYNQFLSCDFNKDFDREKSYRSALEFIFGVMKRIDTPALLTNSFFEELCHFEGGNSVVINNSLKIWESTNFYDILKEWNYRNLN
jgi:hypothetical protein